MDEKETAMNATDYYINGVQLTLDLMSEYINSSCIATEQDNEAAVTAKSIKYAVMEDFKNWIDREVIGKINEGFLEAEGEEFVYMSDGE